MTDTPIVAPPVGTPPVVTPPVVTPPSGDPWYKGATDEEVGYLQNRGWDKVDAKTAALAAGKAHREAEKLIGAPADKIVRLPKDASDAAGIAELYTRLGVPADEKGYDFSGVKLSDGTALDEAFTTELGKTLRAAGVPKDKAPDIAKAIVALGEKETATEAADKDRAIQVQRDALKINWGSNVEANLIIAKNAAAALGVTPEAVAALENSLGYAAVMEMFRNIGARIGEDTFVTNAIPGGRQVMSVEQAKATLAGYENDVAWVTKLNNGDATTLREFDNLTRIVALSGR